MTELLPTGIQMTDMSTKWGLVTVANKDGTLNRQYSITGKEADTIAQGNNIVPSGCTDEEWYSGLAVLYCRPCNQGQAVKNPDGSLMVNHGVVEKDGRVTAQLVQFFPGEYDDSTAVLSLRADLAPLMDVPFKEVKPDLKVP